MAASVPSPAQIAEFLAAKGRDDRPAYERALDKINGICRAPVAPEDPEPGPKKEVALAARPMGLHEIRMKLDEVIRKYGIEPAEELVRLVAERNDEGAYVMGSAQRVAILKDLLQYRMPKLKAVEVGGTVNHSHTINIVRYGDDGRVTVEKMPEQRMSEQPQPLDVEEVPA